MAPTRGAGIDGPGKHPEQRRGAHGRDSEPTKSEHPQQRVARVMHEVAGKLEAIPCAAGHAPGKGVEVGHAHHQSSGGRDDAAQCA